jgi:hypothetical protein
MAMFRRGPVVEVVIFETKAMAEVHELGKTVGLLWLRVQLEAQEQKSLI